MTPVAVFCISESGCVGLDLSSLAYDLPEAPPPLGRYEDGVPDKDARLRAVISDEDWAEWYGRGWTWKDRGHRALVEHMLLAFTFPELVQIWMAEIIESDLSRWVQEQHPVLEKVRLSLWHASCHASYNAVVRGVRGLQSLALPGFDVRLAWCTKYRSDGPARVCEDRSIQPQIWLDNEFGALIHYEGKHVLTVGFGLAEYGVVVSQVQLRQKKGNRWLYKLPDGLHYMDLVLDMLAKAFQVPVWLVEGESATLAVKRSYGSSPCSMTSEDESRIVNLYNRPLKNFKRSEETKGCEGRKYVRLESK